MAQIRGHKGVIAKHFSPEMGLRETRAPSPAGLTRSRGVPTGLVQGGKSLSEQLLEAHVLGPALNAHAAAERGSQHAILAYLTVSTLLRPVVAPSQVAVAAVDAWKRYLPLVVSLSLARYLVVVPLLALVAETCLATTQRRFL